MIYIYIMIAFIIHPLTIHPLGFPGHRLQHRRKAHPSGRRFHVRVAADLVHRRRGQPVVAHRQARQGLVAGLLRGGLNGLKKGRYLWNLWYL